jgi:hypothetical protein
MPTATSPPFDSASSLWIRNCPSDGPYAYKDVNFHCFF